MNAKELKISKIELSGKWMELWIDGMAYDKKTIWDEESETSIESGENNWNFCCKPYQFKESWNESFPENDFDDLLFWNGWNYFIGKIVSIDYTIDKLNGSLKFI